MKRTLSSQFRVLVVFYFIEYTRRIVYGFLLWQATQCTMYDNWTAVREQAIVVSIRSSAGRGVSRVPGQPLIGSTKSLQSSVSFCNHEAVGQVK